MLNLRHHDVLEMRVRPHFKLKTLTLDGRARLSRNELESNEDNMGSKERISEASAKSKTVQTDDYLDLNLTTMSDGLDKVEIFTYKRT